MSLNVPELKAALKSIGFKSFYPVVTTWSDAFIYRYAESVLCVLFRKNGVDFKFYKHYQEGLKVRGRCRISMVGGEIYRNHYNSSQINVHDKILDVCSSYVNGEIREDDIRKEDGHSYKLNKSYIENLKKDKDYCADDDLRSALEGCEDGCGNIYLGDGVYI